MFLRSYNRVNAARFLRRCDLRNRSARRLSHIARSPIMPPSSLLDVHCRRTAAALAGRAAGGLRRLLRGVEAGRSIGPVQSPQHQHEGDANTGDDEQDGIGLVIGKHRSRTESARSRRGPGEEAGPLTRTETMPLPVRRSVDARMRIIEKSSSTLMGSNFLKSLAFLDQHFASHHK